MKKDLISILVEEMSEEVLERMPLWFRRLREAYVKRKLGAFQ